MTLLVVCGLLWSHVHAFTSLNPRAWFSAGNGIVQSAGLVSQWNSSTNGRWANSQGNSTLYPSFVSSAINGQPAVNFSYNTSQSSDRYMLGEDILEPKRAGSMFVYAFSVISLNTASNMNHVIFQEQHDWDKNFWLKIQNGGNMSFIYGGAQDGKVLDTTTASTNFVRGKPNLVSTLYASTTQGGAGAQIKVNGNLVATKTTNQSWAWWWDNTLTYMNRWKMNGSMAEVLLFKWSDVEILTAAQKNQIESYLMIKYGIAPSATSASLFNTSNGLVWNATSNTTYNNNIFGIGRDTVSTLNLSLSESSTDTSIRVQSSTTLANQQYFLMGDNNGAMTWNTAWAPWYAGKISRLNRQWLIQKTWPTNAYTVTLSLPTSQIPTYNGWLYLVVDNDANLTNGIVSYTPMSPGWSRRTVAGLNLTNWQYVSIISWDPSELAAWNASTNTSYNSNVFGIARHDNILLNKITSTQAGSSLTMSVSSFPATAQYLLMGDNNGAMTWSTSWAPVNSSRIARTWLVQKYWPTNAYTTTFSIPASSIPWYGAARVYLTVDNDANFTAGSTSYEMNNFAGVFSVWGITVNNGQYITITYQLPPAIVNGRVWLDNNKNGIEDASETTSLSSVTVRIRSCGPYSTGTQPPINYDGSEITSATTTNGAGNYNFSVPWWVYYIEFTLPSTYKFTTQEAWWSTAANNSDAHPHSGKTKCISFVSDVTTSDIDVGAITQTYSSCDSLTLSNTVMVWWVHYQKPGVSFTANLAWYGQNATIAGTNISTVTNNGTWRAITWNPTLSTTSQWQKTITANVDGADYKLEYYNNPSILSLSCPYKSNGWVYCASAAPLSPYLTPSVNMNTSPTTPAPISYCTPSQLWSPSWACTNTSNLNTLQSSLVSTPNTCSQTIFIYDETALCNSIVTDMSAADCNGLIALYNSAGWASWSTNTRWLFNGDTTWNTACDWHGVTCAWGRVTQINLPSNNMWGSLPSLPAGAWTAVTDINFNANNIGGSLPTAWSTLTAMRYFNIGSNASLAWSLPTTWSTWTQMIGLWINGTNIWGTIPTQWSTWTQLMTFIADWPTNGIWFTSGLPTTWSTMTNMRNFQISNHKVTGIIPTQWSSMTQMRAFLAHNNELDGPIPTTVQSRTLLQTNGWNSVVSSNCMGTVWLSAGLTTWLNSRFRWDNTTSWNNAAAYGWQNQKACAVDLQVTSATITQWDLVNGLSATYSVTVRNNSTTRWAYAPVVTATLAGGLQTSTPTRSYVTLAPWQSDTQTFIVTKGSVAAGTNNVTNSFTVSDTTITDGTTANNTLTNVVSVRWSAYAVCNNASLTVPVWDCEALGDLYTSTNGASWYRRDNWLISPDVNSRFGVTVSAGRVYDICLNRDTSGNAWCSASAGFSTTNANNLTWPLPATIGNLSNLRYLILSYNNISGTLPTTIDQLDSVIYMWINNNNLTWPLPTTIGGLANLRNLYLWGNNINGTIPTQIANLPLIDYIHLDNNDIVWPLPNLTALNDTLEYLVISNNNISWPIPSWIYSMTNLRYLYLNNNPIGGTLSSSINNLTQLTHLQLSSAQMTWPLPNLTIPTLLYAWLYTNQFNGNLPSLPSSILQFEWQDNDFSGTLPTSWWSLTNIEEIFLWSSDLEWQIPTSWAGMTSLKRLGLWNNNLEWAMPVSTLQSMTSLDNNLWWSMIGTNCFYNWSLNASQISFLDTKFSHWTSGIWAWRTQKTCGTDLEVVSVTPTGTLQWANTMTYTITYRNNGPRTAYEPRLTITLANGLQFSDSASSTKVITLWQMAPNASASQVITINKLWVWGTTINYTNSFVISDTTTSDTSSANNTKTHAGTANGSAYPTPCLSTSLTIPQAECEALWDLYTATAGNNWTNRTNWLTSPDVNSWFGVTVAGGRVTSLDIRNNNLVGTLPASIGNLTQLATLYLLSNAGLTWPLPSTIDQLDELTHIYVNSTSINWSLPTTIWGMAKMTYFVANNTNISGIPTQIANMPMLNQLHLHSTNITSVPDMSALNNTLRVLYLHSNSITWPIPTWMGNMTNLTYFYIGYNPFTAGPMPSWICNLSNLTHLYIAGNNLTGELPSCFDNAFPQMRIFQIQWNQLEWELPVLSNSSFLTHYYVHANRFVWGMPTWLPSISTFRYMYLDSNRLTGPIPDEYANMSTDNIIFRVHSNNLDRDTAGNAIISPALQSRWDSIVVYVNNPGAYKTINNQSDITAPLLWSNAKRIPPTPSFNRQGKPFSQVQITGPHNTPVVATLLSSSPSHVWYDAGAHQANFQAGKTYTFSFWARTVAGSRTIDPSLTDNVNSGPTTQIHTIDTTWRQITVTKTYTSSIWAGPRAFINIGTAGGDFYYYDPVITESPAIPSDIRSTSIAYATMITDGSDFATSGHPIVAGGWGLCSNITVTPASHNDKWLVVYYTFDDGDVSDKAWWDNNGTPVNIWYTDGRMGQWVFETSAGWHIVHPTTGLSPTNGTISIWAKPTVLSSWGIWQTYDSVSANWVDWISMFAWTDTLMYFRMGNGSACCNNDLTVNHSLSLTPGSWNHLVFTWEGDADGVLDDVMRIYINGNLAWSRSNANFQSVINSMARVWYGHTRDINGTLDDFRAYNRALSATEISSMYAKRMNFAQPGNYNGCFITADDRAGNDSNAVRLGDFTVTFSPHAICNNPDLTIPQEQCTALMDIYTSTAWANWSQRAWWNISPDVSTWWWVTTELIWWQQQVRTLCLNRVSSSNNASTCGYNGIGNNLVGTLPASIGNLPYLAALDLSNNVWLTGPIPASVGQLTNVTTFYIVSSKLNGTLPDSIGDMTSLMNLYLWSNDLSGSLPSAWGNAGKLPNIRYIHLSSNLLSWPIPASWANFADTMTAFVLSSQRWATKLNGTLPSWLSNFTSINWVLHLNGNQFTGPIPDLSGLSSAVQVYLHGNQLTWPIPATLAGLTSATHLELSSNQLTWPIPTQLSSLTNLSVFSVAVNNLDRDLSNNAIIPSALTTWYNGIATKNISSQWDTTAPVISGNPLAGTYSFDTMSYDITLTENSAIAAAGMTVTVAGGGTCSQISVIGTLTNRAWSNTIQLRFAPGTLATTAYSNCTLRTTDRAWLVSNTINLGSFSVKLNPFPICNNVNLTISQEQCTALMDFYTNTNWPSWTNRTNWSAGTDVNSWFGITTSNSLVAQYDFTSNASDSSPSAANGTVGAGITFTSGKNGNSATFPASHAGITANIPSITKDQTICMWLKPDNLSARRNPYNKAYGGEGTITQETNGVLNYFYGIHGGNSQPHTAHSTAAWVVAPWQWTHACLVRDLSSTNKTMTWYINGAYHNQRAAPYDTAATSPGLTTIGNGYTSPYNGQIDDMRIYNRALSTDEVNQLFLSNTMGAQTVTQINFPSANNIVGTIPNMFDKLPDLTNIQFVNNMGVIWAIPDSIFGLPKLLSLILQNLSTNSALPTTLPLSLGSVSINNLANMPAWPLPSAWSANTNLTYISVQNINRNGALPPSWSALTNLTYMHLANNNFNSQIPQSWLDNLTNIWQMYWEGANIDGPLPVELLNWNTNTTYSANNLNNNCFGTSHLTPAQVNSFNSRWTNAKWQPQRACSTDLQLTITPAGNLTSSNAMLYTITVTNAGSRWAYSPRVAVSLWGNLRVGGSASTTLSFDTLAPGTSQTQTITVVKSPTTPTGTANVTNTFALTDTTITDSNTSNNNISNVQSVFASSRRVCNHYGLNTTIGDCEALVDLYNSTAWASWTNRSNWTVSDTITSTTSPNIDSWFGITTNRDDDLLAHYSFDNSNGSDESGNARHGTTVSATYAAGRIANWANFNGAGNGITIPTTTLGNGDWTVSAWVRTTDMSANYGNVLSNRSSWPVFNAMWVSNGKIKYSHYDTAWRQYEWTANVANGSRHLLTWVNKSNNTMDMYVNGVLDRAWITSFTANGWPLDSIGRNWYSSFNWSVDDLRIYNRGLSAAEVTALYQTANPSADRVIALQLGNWGTYSAAWGNNLNGTLPTTLSFLTELTHLWLNGNPNLSGVIPSNFWNLFKIQDIRLFWTQLSGNLPSFGSSFPSLNTIYMSHTRLSWWLPTTWSQNIGLNVIWLWANAFGSERITGNLPPSWWSLVNLTNLAVYYAGLTGPIPTQYGAMQNMGNFQLAWNQMSWPIPPSLSQWSTPYAFYIQDNQFTGNLNDILSGWNANTISYFWVNNNNFDRDSNNNAILPSSIVTRWPNMLNYVINNQWDVTAPVLAWGSLATNADDVVQVTFTLTEWSSTTWAWFADGLTVWFTGSAACAGLTTSPVKLLNKWSLTLDIIWAAGSYPWCRLWVRDRANNLSNLLTLATITIPNYAICGTVTDITRSDCRVLVDLYESAWGVNRTRNDNWMWLGDPTPTTASDWFGVTLTNSRVTYLNLNANGVCGRWSDATSNNLVGTLPNSIGNLTWLGTICIARNPNLVGWLPASFNNLTALNGIGIHSNGLWWAIPDLSNLNPTTAILHSNWFTGPVPSFANWSNISYLYLYTNNLSGPLPQLPATMPNLHTLNFSNNNFSGYLPASYGQLTAARRFILNNNDLTWPIPDSWWNLLQLNHLQLHNNNLRWLIPSSFANLTNLVNNGWLYLGNNCLSVSSSYMTTALQTLLNSKFHSTSTTQLSTCGNDIRTTVWNDSNNDGQRDITESKISGVTATLRACTDQTAYNTSEKLLNREMSSYYSFDTDNTIDDSDNSNSMVNSNVTYADGRIGRAASFAGNWYLLKNNYNNFPTTQITTAFWVKTTDSGQGLISYATSNIDNNEFLLFNSANLEIWIGSIPYSAGVSFNDNQRHHIVVSYDDSEKIIRVYKDGTIVHTSSVLTASRAITPWWSLAIGGEQDALGGWRDNAQAHNGLMDDVRIYNRVLSATEISQLYQSTNPQAAVNIPIGYTGASVTSATTAADGTATFANRTPGRYYIEYSNIPAGYKFTTQNVWWAVNIIWSDVNPWSAKTSCFELYNGTSEMSIDAGLKLLPYSSCEATTAAQDPILLGQPVSLSVWWYGSNANITVRNTSNTIVLNQNITNQWANRWLKTWTHNRTPTAVGSYTIAWSVDGFTSKMDYYNNASLLTASCAYRTISAGNWCAVQPNVAPFGWANITNVNQIATIPSPISYCTASQISTLPCSTAGDQPSAMVVQVPNTCNDTLVVTSSTDVMCDAVTDMQPAECKALVSLYDSTAGASWTTRTNWRFLWDTTPRTACDWHGVTCAWWRVTQISLASNNLTGPLPSLSGLSALTHLYLNSNRINGWLPTNWPTTLPLLHTFNLSNNQISGWLPTQRSTWASIRYIDVSQNSLTWPLPTNWSSLVNLINLSAWANNFSGQLPTTWSTMSKLETLALSSTSINGNLPTSWSNMTGMQTFMIVNSQLTGTVPQSWLISMNQMRAFQIWGNNMDWPIPATGFQSWTNLNTAGTFSAVGDNCMGTTHLTASDQSYLNVRFPGMEAARWWTNSRWNQQKTCQTDLQLSLVSKAWSLEDANTITYTLEYTNAWSRWSYDSRLALSADSRITIAVGSTPWVSKTGINLGILAPWSSGTVTFVIGKTSFPTGIYNNLSHSFTLTDTTIQDIVSTNHTYADTNLTVDVSNYPICNNPSLTIPFKECKNLMATHDALGWASWTNKTWWGTDPTVDNWYGVKTNASMVAYYSFDANNANDDSGNGYNGSLMNWPTFVPGKFGNAIRFDGINDWVRIAPWPVLDWWQDQSISFWANGTQWGNPFAASNEPAWWAAWYHRFFATNLVTIDINNAYNYYNYPVSMNSVNGRQHYTFTRDWNTGRLYIDGILVAQWTFTADFYDLQAYWLGRNCSWASCENYFNGMVDEVRIFNRALTASEVTQLYQSNALAESTSRSSLVAHYPFDSNGNDSGPNGLNTSPNPTFTVWWNGMQLVPGQYGNALNNWAVTVNDTSVLDIADKLTLLLWMKPESEGVYYAQHPFNKGKSTASSNFMLYYFGNYLGNNLNRNIWFYANAWWWWKPISSMYPKLPLNQWTHVALSYDKDLWWQLYINGTAYGARNGWWALAINTDTLRIGDRDQGEVDEVRIFNDALSAVDIQQLYQSNEFANRVVSLSLWSNNLNGAFPSIMTNLDALTHVDMLNKPWAWALPSLSNLSNLRWLRCDNCAINGSLPTTINSTKLTTLSLSGNQISALTPNLYATPTLQTVIMSSNPIGGTLPTGFASLPVLNTLRLDNGWFTGPVPQAWSSMTNLQELGLANNNLSQELPTVLQSLTWLRRLYLNDNELDWPIPEWLTGFVNLQ